jgi:hypothetical protein
MARTAAFVARLVYFLQLTNTIPDRDGQASGCRLQAMLYARWLTQATAWPEKKSFAVNAVRISGMYSRMGRNQQGCGIVSIQHHWISKVPTEPLFNLI